MGIKIQYYGNGYGKIVTLLPENSQIILSPGPLVYKLRKLLKNITNRLFIINRDPAIIGKDVQLFQILPMENSIFKMDTN